MQGNQLVKGQGMGRNKTALERGEEKKIFFKSY